MTNIILKEEPLFSIKHFFRPTNKNVLGWATTIKGLAAAGLATSFATANTYIFVACLMIGGLAEAFILFTSETPVVVIQEAVEDIKEDIKEQINDTEQH